MNLNEVKTAQKIFQARDKDYQKLIDLLKLLSNKIRFRVICLLQQNEYCVSEIVEIIQAGKISNVSQQLQLLTQLDILDNRRDKKKIYYTLKDDKISHLINFLEENFLG